MGKSCVAKRVKVEWLFQKALSWNASGDSWIHVNGSSVSYDENPAKERRTGLVTLKQDESGKTLSLKIVQPGKTSIDIEQ